MKQKKNRQNKTDDINLFGGAQFIISTEEEFWGNLRTEDNLVFTKKLHPESQPPPRWVKWLNDPTKRFLKT